MPITLSSILALLFPARCLGCSTPGSGLCARCIKTIPFALPPLGRDTFAVYEYGNRLVARAIYALKYYRRAEAATALMRAGGPHISEWLADQLQSFQGVALTLVPVPQHRRKTNSRGFNQSSVLCNVLAEVLPGSSVAPLLTKTRATVSQTRVRGKTARFTNVAQSMAYGRSLDPHACYLVVDDVTTTGATLTEAMRVLRAAGARAVLGVALAHGYAHR